MTYKYSKKKKKAYVVFYGRAPGLYETWAEVKKQVDGFPDNHHLGYASVEDAEEAWEDHLASLEDEDEDDSELDLDDVV